MKMHFFPTSSSQTLLNSVQPFGDWGLQVKNPCIRRKEPRSLKDCVGPPTWPAWIVTSEINKPLWCYATEVWKSAVRTVSLLLPINIVAVTPSPKWWDRCSFVYRSSRISAIKPMWGPPVQPLFYRAVIYTFRRWLIRVLPMGLVSWSCHRPPHSSPPKTFYTFLNGKDTWKLPELRSISGCWGMATFSMACGRNITAAEGCRSAWED